MMHSDLNELNKKRLSVKRSRTGLGLYARDTFKKGEKVIEYVGTLITGEAADAKPNNRYYFEIDKKWTIDGSPRSNMARYANHSCKPNAESDVIQGRVYIIARRKILPGEEITYDYGEEYIDEYIKGKCRCAACQSNQ